MSLGLVALFDDIAAIAKVAAASLDDGALIDAVYDERSNVEKYFRRSTAGVKQSVRNRFKEERDNAHKLLREA